MFGETWVTLAVAFVIGTFAVGRVARLIAEDDWPPSMWLRDLWIRITRGGGWSYLMLCTFCLTPYLAAADLAWAILTDLQAAWWVVNAWLAGAYLAAIITARDLPADAREQG